MANQLHYNAYNALTGEKLDLSVCNGDNVTYSFTESGFSNYALAKKIKWWIWRWSF